MVLIKKNLHNLGIGNHAPLHNHKLCANSLLQKLKLKADGVLVNANKKIELKIDDKYPKKIDYFGKEVIIKDVKYSKGHLTVKYTTDSSISYDGGSELDGNSAISTSYEVGSKISGIEFENVEKKDSYALDLRLVLKYSYPINIEIENR